MKDKSVEFLGLRVGAILCLVVLAACSAGPIKTTPTASLPPATSTSLPPTATETQTPSPAPTSTRTPTSTIVGTDTLTPVPTLAVDASIGAIYLKNVGANAYLYEKDNIAYLSKQKRTDPSAQWLLEDFQGGKRIKNLGSGDYLTIEHQQRSLEVIPVQPTWQSPVWSLELDKLRGSVAITNVWHNWEVLYSETGSDQALHGRAPVELNDYLWNLEPVSGKALPTATPTPAVQMPPANNPVGSRGAAVPWVEYEAEEGKTNAKLIGPDRTFGTIAAESSGRQSVQLEKVGDFVQFTASKAANSIVVRYVIPDSQDGLGQEATISLYVNDTFVCKLNLTSKYAWSYGGEESSLNKPNFGGAHHYFDEARALIKDIPQGASVKLQKDADDTADYYVVDLVDLEQVSGALSKPENALDVVADCGAKPDDGQDDGNAIQTCIGQAKTQHKTVWIPAGTFEVSRNSLNVENVQIHGAGMWYTILHGPFATFNCIGSGCQYFDFAILGETIARDDTTSDNGFNGGAGYGSRLENIWVEHTKVGYWVGGYSNGLIVRGSRFRNLFADGINFCNGTSNSLVENSHFRNTGDDALASWSPRGSGVNKGNVFRFNTVQIPWRANCFAIYGGEDNQILDNVCADTVLYPGIYIAQSFDSNPFGGTTSILRNTLVRAGGPMYGKEFGALTIEAIKGPIVNVVVKDLMVVDATFSGIELEGPYDTTGIVFDQIKVSGSGTYGVWIGSLATGDASFSNVTVADNKKGGVMNQAPGLKLKQGGGNSGW
jgi:hypothetical protein